MVDLAALSPADRAVLEEYQRRIELDALASRCRESLYEFTKAAWHVLEPDTPMVDNWHIKALCDAVQCVLEGWRQAKLNPSIQNIIWHGQSVARMQNLLINVPPGTGKSRIICVMAPCWMWLDSPGWRAIFFSGNPRVTSRDSMYRRDLLESEWYRRTFRPEWKLKEDANLKLQFNNDRGGFMSALTAGQKVIGDRGDALFVDDPNDPEEVLSDDERTKINETWWDQSVANRLNSGDVSVRIGVMQRLHQDDWAGHVMAQEVEGVRVWWHLCIRQEYEPEVKCPCGREVCTLPIGKLDPRTEPGELLDPVRFSERVLKQERARLLESGYAGQHQQHPFPKGGGILKRANFCFYDPALVPEMRFDEQFQSWDMTFKKTKKSDFVCGQVWGIKGAHWYLLAQFHKRADLPATIDAVRAMSKSWPDAVAKYVEDKANGPAVISSLQNEIIGLIPVNPQGGKEVRAHAVAPMIDGHNVWLPDPKKAPWVESLLGECEAFPNGLHDDQVDAMTQALVKTRDRRYVEHVDNRTTEDKIWDAVEEEEKLLRLEKRMEEEQLGGPDVYGAFGPV